MSTKTNTAAPAPGYQPLPPPMLWRDKEGLRGYGADPGPGPWYTADQMHAHARAAKAAYALEPMVARIKSADENARAAGHVGLFLTLTCPLRFHPGQASYDGSTPRDANQWLRKMWARVRAELARSGVRMYGVRIAEPHRDGCPHWHAMLWLESSAAADNTVQVFRKHWLREDGDERGAQRHRVTDMRMEGTGGAGYVAKYISKGLHRTPWPAAWGIRPLQTIGEPFGIATKNRATNACSEKV